MPVKRILCLANSRKLHGRCVAGVELIDGKPAGWVRPVSARQHQEVSEYERQYEDGSDPRMLDIIDIPLLSPAPHGYQQENWLLDPQEYWQRNVRIGWSDLPRFASPVGPLWIDGASTYNGLHDSIPMALAVTLDSSLKLVRVPFVTLRVGAPGEVFGNTKRRVQARFFYAGKMYAMWVTDPGYEREFLALDNGEYNLGQSFLTISLGEPFNGSVYKMVAAMLEPNRGKVK